VVPKRHARRAVTRNLVKRLMRATFQARADRLASGIWLVRLRSGFDRALYPSATSTALRREVREELERLFDGCADVSPAPN
jgi:ribonuclease P protein component